MREDANINDTEFDSTLRGHCEGGLLFTAVPVSRNGVGEVRVVRRRGESVTVEPGAKHGLRSPHRPFPVDTTKVPAPLKLHQPKVLRYCTSTITHHASHISHLTSHISHLTYEDCPQTRPHLLHQTLGPILLYFPSPQELIDRTYVLRYQDPICPADECPYGRGRNAADSSAATAIPTGLTQPKSRQTMLRSTVLAHTSASLSYPEEPEASEENQPGPT